MKRSVPAPATRAEFITLLHALSDGTAAADLPIDAFLLRWAALVPDHGKVPGWPGLAAQVTAALTAERSTRSTDTLETAPPADAPAPGRPERPDARAVTTSADLRHHLRLLAADYLRDQREFYEPRRRQGLWAEDGGDWANTSLPALLGCWASWLEDTTDHPRFDPRLIEPVTWASVAEQLAAARIYE